MLTWLSRAETCTCPGQWCGARTLGWGHRTCSPPSWTPPPWWTSSSIPAPHYRQAHIQTEKDGFWIDILANVFYAHNAFFTGAYLSVVRRVEQIVRLVLQLLNVQLPSLFSADEVRRVISPAHREQTLLLLRSLECLSSLRVSLQPAPGRIKVWSLEIIFFFTILLPTVLLTKNILSYWKLF